MYRVGPYTSEKTIKGTPLHFWSRTPTFGFLVCLVELNVLNPKNKKFFRSDDLLKNVSISRNEIKDKRFFGILKIIKIR